MGTAILWPFRFKDFKGQGLYPWGKRIHWVCSSLSRMGYEVIKHKDFLCEIPDAIPYSNQRECDIVVYNHADISEIRGDVVKAKKTWFFKPTVPDVNSTTLDELGYGSYSSITYQKPPYEHCDKSEVNDFFETKVQEWIAGGQSKWGSIFNKVDFPHKDYYLILGQCGGDSVLVRQDFGSYFAKMLLIIKELDRIGDRQIVVKLHPYTAGVDLKDTKMVKYLLNEIDKINKNIIVVHDFTSVHSLLPNCHSVIVGNSGAGFEAMMHHKPIISFCFPEYHWATFDLRKVCDLHRAIKTDEWFDKRAGDNFFYWYAEKYCFYDQASSDRRVSELLGK